MVSPFGTAVIVGVAGDGVSEYEGKASTNVCVEVICIGEIFGSQPTIVAKIMNTKKR
jgi:hypothetical protein